MKNKVIDLFAGAGGLSCGFTKANFSIDSAVEFDKTIANTYKANHPNTTLYVDDIKNIALNNIFKNKKIDVVIGGPPCQGFSMAGARIRKSFIDDERNYLFKYYYEIIKQTKPKCFVFENVKGITTMENGNILKKILELFQNKKMLNGDSYNIYTKVYNATEYGIPQKRERFIIIGVLNHAINFFNILEETKQYIEKKYPDFFQPVSVWDAISNLTNDKNETELIRKPTNNYQKFLASKTGIIYNTNKPSHNKLIVERIKKIKCGENWTQLNDENIKSIHSGSYGRLEKNKPSPTITTRFDTPSGGRFIHPVENRTLSPREGARLQSFPDDFKFLGTKTSIYKQIGNAVPPKLAFFLANVIKIILKENFKDGGKYVD